MDRKEIGVKARSAVKIRRSIRSAKLEITVEDMMDSENRKKQAHHVQMFPPSQEGFPRDIVETKNVPVKNQHQAA